MKRHLDESLADPDRHDAQLAEAAARVQVLHTVRVCESWVGGLSKTRRAALR